MALLSNIETDESVEDKDSLGGGSNFQPVDSAIYLAKVTMAYSLKSQKGALGVYLTLLTEDNHEVSEKIFITAAKDNKKATFKYPIINSLSLLTAGKDIIEVSPEEKVVDQWNFDLKKNIPTKVEMLTELMGKDVYVGIMKVRENKKDYNNNYAPLAEDRVYNRIDKFFHSTSKLTTVQIKAGQTDPTFFNDWKNKNTGRLIDEYKPVAATAANPATSSAPDESAHNIFEDELS